MTNLETEALAQVKSILAEDTRDFLLTQQTRLGDLSKKDNKGLLAFHSILTFWCADGIIRMVGVKEEKALPQSAWWEIYDQAVLFAELLGLESMAKLYIQSRSAQSIRSLLVVRTDLPAVQKEIKERIERPKLAPEFLKYLDSKGGPAETKEFLEQVSKGIGGWRTKNEKIRRSIESFRSALRIPLEIDISYENRKPIKMEDDLLSQRRSAALIKTHEYYEDLKKAVDTGDWSAVSFSVMDYIPANNPQWNQVAPGMLQEEIRVDLENYLPIMDGKTKRIPFELYNADRTAMRREFQDRPIIVSKEDFEVINEDDEEKIPWDAIEFLFRSHGIREAPFENGLFVRSHLKEILGPVDDLEKATDAVILILLGATQKKAAIETGLTTRTLRNYLKKIKEFSSRNQTPTE